MIFISGLVLLAVLAAIVAAAPLWRRGLRLPGMLAAIMVVGTTVGVYLIIGRPDLGISPPRVAEAQTAEDIIAMVDRLAARLEAAPDDPTGWTMLGRAYVLMGRYDEAVRAFGEAMARIPGEDPDLMASYAEARVMQSPESLPGETGALFERVLVLDPGNQRALWYGGLAAQVRGDNPTAVQRWQALLAQEIPAEFRRVLESRIAGIDPGALDAIVLVEVGIAPELANALQPGTVLFVALRPADETQPGPPLAARRLEFFSLPETVPLMHGDLLRGDLPEGRMRVIARLTASGDASGAAGDIEGHAEWSPADGKTVRVVLDRRRGE